METIHSGKNWRVRVVPDNEVEYDDSYIDTWDETDERKAQAKKELRARIESDGVWGLVGEVKCKCCGAWEIIHAVGGFVGEDWKGSGYDEDTRKAAEERANERFYEFTTP